MAYSECPFLQLFFKICIPFEHGQKLRHCLFLLHPACLSLSLQPSSLFNVYQVKKVSKSNCKPLWSGHLCRQTSHWGNPCRHVYHHQSSLYHLHQSILSLELISCFNHGQTKTENGSKRILQSTQRKKVDKSAF